MTDHFSLITWNQGLWPWRRSGTPPCCRIRPGSRTRPRCDGRSSRRCRRRRLIGEGAAEMLEGAPGEEARESACGDIHQVQALSHRRSSELEGYGQPTTTDHVAVRRDPINPEVAR